MANNRMFIKCGRCGEISPIVAKYYPHTQWCFKDNADKLTAWIQEHHHDNFSASGPVWFTVEIEEKDDIKVVIVDPEFVLRIQTQTTEL